ncbi:uncharacterized protein [Watersipora subatra]|uniref:uncharacterized protein n=1 Tax=Watersipora subatra TaxID=2589382 RepID=UPI00355B87AF
MITIDQSSFASLPNRLNTSTVTIDLLTSAIFDHQVQTQTFRETAPDGTVTITTRTTTTHESGEVDIQENKEVHKPTQQIVIKQPDETPEERRARRRAARQRASTDYAEAKDIPHMELEQSSGGITVRTNRHDASASRSFGDGMDESGYYSTRSPSLDQQTGQELLSDGGTRITRRSTRRSYIDDDFDWPIGDDARTVTRTITRESAGDDGSIQFSTDPSGGGSRTVTRTITRESTGDDGSIQFSTDPSEGGSRTVTRTITRESTGDDGFIQFSTDQSGGGSRTVTRTITGRGTGDDFSMQSGTDQSGGGSHTVTRTITRKSTGDDGFIQFRTDQSEGGSDIVTRTIIREGTENEDGSIQSRQTGPSEDGHVVIRQTTSRTREVQKSSEAAPAEIQSQVAKTSPSPAIDTAVRDLT